MSGSEEKDMLAAEYALGTLSSAEREAIDARRSHDEELNSAIEAWESRLSAWLTEYDPVTPPAHLRAVIAERIERRQTGALRQRDEPHKLRRSLNRWRTAALTGYAIAASLLALVVLREAPVAPEDHFVAVFQNDDQQPAFIMSIDLKSRSIIVRPVTAQPAQGKTYQLWIASNQLGGKPRSLGLIGDATKPTRKTLPYDSELLVAATFGISIEPEGGSPTGTPTGKAIHGRLIPTNE